jgi:hypothetical protein
MDHHVNHKLDCICYLLLIASSRSPYVRRIENALIVFFFFHSRKIKCVFRHACEADTETKTICVFQRLNRIRKRKLVTELESVACMVIN